MNGHSRARMRAAMGKTKQFVYAVGTLSSTCCCEPKDGGCTSLDDSASRADANSLSVAGTADTCKFAGIQEQIQVRVRN